MHTTITDKNLGTFASWVHIDFSLCQKNPPPQWQTFKFFGGEGKARSFEIDGAWAMPRHKVNGGNAPIKVKLMSIDKILALFQIWIVINSILR